MNNKIEKEVESLKNIKLFGQIVTEGAGVVDQKGHLDRRIAILIPEQYADELDMEGRADVIGIFEAVIPLLGVGVYDAIEYHIPPPGFIYHSTTITESTNVIIKSKHRYTLTACVEFNDSVMVQEM